MSKSILKVMMIIIDRNKTDKLFQIDENETTGELWDKLAKIGGKLLVETLEQIENGMCKLINIILWK